LSAIDYCTGYLMAMGAMIALARRAEQGGSWLVRISLAQVGKWLVDLGQVPEAALKGVPAEFSQEELARWYREIDNASELNAYGESDKISPRYLYQEKCRPK